ncbi:MAG TPA: hypothetical protein VNV66_20455 [Pilimelia sp.]|nr:hypothetical protein [Pilimelia sp.]
MASELRVHASGDLVQPPDGSCSWPVADDHAEQDFSGADRRGSQVLIKAVTCVFNL